MTALLLPTLSRARQQGGSILGFIVGLVAGLGLALVIAVYVTKAPSPLMDRGIQRPSFSLATEAERLRNWNPNAPLTGQPAASNTPAAASAPAATPAPAPAASQDLISQLLEKRSPPAAGSPAPADAAAADPFTYFVQIGAFRSKEDAQAQRARLSLAGFKAEVSEREQGGKMIFRVRLGPFERRVDAELTDQRVKGQGFDSVLVRIQR